MSKNKEDSVYKVKRLMVKKLNMKFIDADTPTRQLTRLFNEKFPKAVIRVCQSKKTGKIYFQIYATPIEPTAKQLLNWAKFAEKQYAKYGLKKDKK